jgi:pyruvate oxidase
LRYYVYRRSSTKEGFIISITNGEELKWFRLGPSDMLQNGRITTVQAGHHTVCQTRTEEGHGAISNRCSHQEGPLGDGFLQDGCVVCPWHGYEYHPITGATPPEYGDEPVEPYPV